MTKRIKNLSLAFMSLILAVVCAFIYCTDNYRITKTCTEAIIRDIEVSQKEIDYQSIFDEFDDGKLETVDNITTFEGVKTFNSADFEELDNLSEDVINLQEKTSVKYYFSFDAETGIVTLSAETIDGNGFIEIDEIQGLAFYDEYGNIDAILDVDGESVLLSEMQNSGLIANCGWFKRLWKKIAVAVVAVVAVAAVAAVVVATCGAGLGACIAAGAVAGGITGGVAGGIISYQETGEVQIWAVVGGLIGGAIIGGLTGWAVGSIMGAGTQMKVGFNKGSFKTSEECLKYHFNKHGAEVGAKTIKEYSKMAAQTAQQVVKNGIPAIRQVAGATANVYRYEVGNYYIHMAMSSKEIIIVSFGLI